MSIISAKAIGVVCVLSASLITAPMAKVPVGTTAVDLSTAQISNLTSNEVMTSSNGFFGSMPGITIEIEQIAREALELPNLHQPLTEMIEESLSVTKDEEVIEEKIELLPSGQIIVDGARLRKKANTKSDILNLMYKGMIFDVVSQKGNFLKIKYNGITGYVDVSLVEQYEDEPPYEVYKEPEKPKITARSVKVAQVTGTPHYNPSNLRELSNLSEQQIYNMLEGSDLQKLYKSYYKYEMQYGVNAIFLMSLNSLESGHGTSGLARYNNNIGGVKSSNGGWRTFDSWDSCLNYIADLINRMYLSEGARYYSGKSIWNVNKRYCEGTEWATKINSIASKLISKN